MTSTDTGSAPKAFVSHNLADKAVAEELATALRALGVDAWFDKWEIAPGDSLVQKIFAEGLAHCAVFLVLLSPESVASKWVREELDVALVRRIEGATRVVPVVVRKCEVPMALRALLRLDIGPNDIATTAQKIADVAFGRTAKPPIRSVSPVRHRVEGLTEYGAALAAALAPGLTADRTHGFTGPALMEVLSLSASQVNDAVDELVDAGLARADRALGTHPFDFLLVEPTYDLGLRLRGSGVIDYDPHNDILQVASVVASLQNVVGSALAENVTIGAGRLNQAVRFLADHGHVEVLHALGTAPYDFMLVTATPATRRFVAANAV